MGGARLETQGQIRGVYPHLASHTLTFTWSLTAGFGKDDPIIIDRSDIPFDRGPDKTDQVFIHFHSISVICYADVYGTAVFDGFINFVPKRTSRRLTLLAIASTPATSFAVMNNCALTSPVQITGESVDSIGTLSFQNRGSTLGTASALGFSIRLTLGIYANYAEPDWERLFALRVPHEHVGLSTLREP